MRNSAAREMVVVALGLALLTFAISLPLANGIETPPGGAMSLTPALARLIIREMVATRLPVSVPKTLMFQGYTLSEARNVQLSATGLAFAYDIQYSNSKGRTKTAELSFLREYCTVRPSESARSEFRKQHFYYTCSNEDYWKGFLYTWRTQSEAQRFTDAVNRLIYEAQGGSAPEFISAFRARVQQWRTDPAQRSAPPGLDRHRLLAEDAIRGKDFIRALQHYGDGLRQYEFWPEGWFNSALLYGELGEFGAASDCMKHYLELEPNAPDAQAARDKLVIWEEKARHP